MPPGTRAGPRAFQPDGLSRAQHEPGGLPPKLSLPNGGELWNVDWRRCTGSLAKAEVASKSG
eukprot:10915836-Heterocapsa_arctica.AAC.1